MTTFVIRRNSDNKYYKNRPKRRYDEKLYSDSDNWIEDLQRARTYTNKGGATTALPYGYKEEDYTFVEVELKVK